MAQRRMFSLKIVSSDAFLDMPTSSRELYFQLGMYADDDGFVNPKKIIRMIGASDDDIKVLIGKRFLLPFENGVVVIKHWLVNNLIRKDFYQETIYLEQKNSLEVKENKAYTECKQNVNNLDTQDRIGKDRIGKDSEGYVSCFDRFWNSYPKRENKKGCEEKWKSKKLDSKIDEVLSFIEKAKGTDRWKKGFVKAPLVFINQESWNDDIDAYNDIKKTSGVIDLRTKK